MLACLPCCVCDYSAVGAGGLKKTTCLRNGKGRELCWAECVRHDEHSFIHSLVRFHLLSIAREPVQSSTHLEGRYFRQETDGRCSRRRCVVTSAQMGPGSQLSERERSEAENGKAGSFLKKTAKCPTAATDWPAALGPVPATCH